MPRGTAAPAIGYGRSDPELCPHAPSPPYRPAPEMRPYRPGTLAAASAILLLAACSDGPAAPPGSPDRLGVLQSPHGPEGAAVLEVSGGPFLEVRPDGGELHAGTADGVTRIVVVQHEPGEIRFRVRMDPSTPDPVVRILQVAGPDDVLRRDLSAYRVTFTAENR
jgi:hypothetical protein